MHYYNETATIWENEHKIGSSLSTLSFCPFNSHQLDSLYFFIQTSHKFPCHSPSAWNSWAEAVKFMFKWFFFGKSLYIEKMTNHCSNSFLHLTFHPSNPCRRFASADLTAWISYSTIIRLRARDMSGFPVLHVGRGG